MNKERVLQALDNLKGSLETMDYGKWGALNVEQRNFMRALCNSWLILDDATNKQMEEIERLKEINKELGRDYSSANNGYLRLHSIIKEVREYIASYINQFNGVYPSVDMRYLDLNKLLKILDKESKL